MNNLVRVIAIANICDRQTEGSQTLDRISDSKIIKSKFEKAQNAKLKGANVDTQWRSWQ